MSLHIDISQGFILHKFIELLGKFLEVPNIRSRFMRDNLLPDILEALIVIRGLIVQKTKLISDCNRLLNDLLDSLLLEISENKRQFIRACISGLQNHNEVERARGIFERFIHCHPKVSAWIRYAKFEMKNGEVGKCRNWYERAVEKFPDEEELFVAFAEFEERCKETEWAQCIYKVALDHIPKGSAEDLYRKFVAFEKQHGNKEGIEDALVGKRRFQYEDGVRKNLLNYDAWFDYIMLEESVGDKERIREVYERAIANVPPAEGKRYTCG